MPWTPHPSSTVSLPFSVESGGHVGVVGSSVCGELVDWLSGA